MDTYLKIKLKLFLAPIGALSVLLILTIAATGFILERLSPIGTQLEQVKINQSALEGRLSSLQQIDPEVLALSEASYVAFPPENPAVLVTSQLRKKASEYQVILTNINISSLVSQEEGGTSKTLIEFKANGQYDAIISFMSDLATLSPIINIERAKYTSKITSFDVEATLNSYWAPFPKELPALTDAQTGLSDDELQTLAILSDFEQPLLNQSPESTASGRLDPFDPIQ